MKKIPLIFILFLNIAFLQDDCSDITNPQECYEIGCQWIFDNSIADGYCTEVDIDGCEGLSQDECTASEQCDWATYESPAGSYETCIDAEDWDGNDDGSPDCLDDCEGIDNINPEDDPYEACDWIISIFGNDPGFLSCTQDCDDETMMKLYEVVDACYNCLESDSIDCADVFDDEDEDQGCYEDGEFYCFGCEMFISDCDYYECTENGWMGPFTLDNDDCSSDNWSCSDINNLYECYAMGCEWISGNMPGAGSCVDQEEDCDPYLECATVITCYEGLLYPTACGPENCDDPIGYCDDDNQGCQNDEGQWYDFGYEMFISDCDYYECTVNGWVGPFTLDNDDCSDNGGDWECSELGYEDCMYYDFCEWVPNNNNPAGGGYCTDADDNNDDGAPECVMDCEGVENIDPEENTTYFCQWLLEIFPSGCAEDCDQETLDEIEEYMIFCDECLAENNCDEENDVECAELNYADCIESDGCEWIIVNDWGGYSCVEADNEDNCNDLSYDECMESSNCVPNFNAAGEFESCNEADNHQSFGFLYGTVQYIYGDAIEFIPYATLHIESLPSNSDMFTFEVMTDGDGFYQIELPVGGYIVTAYANNESLSQDVFISPDIELQLDFLLGEWSGPDYPYANLSLGEGYTAFPGSTITLPLYLSSNESVGGVQFTIGATPGLTPISIESIDPCFSADSNLLEDEQLIGIIFSFEGCSYPPEEMLEIAHIVFNISPYVTVGSELEIYFNDTIVSDSVGNEIYSYGEGTVILTGTLGDVNADGDLNVLDVVMLVNFALLVEYPNDLEFWASDLNGDGFINVLDVVNLVNFILEN